MPPRRRGTRSCAGLPSRNTAGIPAARAGWVSVGVDHDTSAFAVNTIRSWWTSTGRACHPHATRLLITADGGGSNGYRTRARKTELAQLATETGLGSSNLTGLLCGPRR